MAWYTVRHYEHGMVYGKAWRALHMVYGMACWVWNAIWYGLAGIPWYMVWPSGHGVVYDMVWQA